MSKQIRIPVRALGSEVEDPEISVLTPWVSAHRGIEADLFTYKLEESLMMQEGVDIPAAGGRFYGPRLVSSLTGVYENILSSEPAVKPEYIIGDADLIISIRKGAWCSLPAPHLWDIQDHYFHDDEEFRFALYECIQQLMRTMRDRGVKGHILLCDRYHEDEMEELAGPKVLFYTENPNPKSLSILLEHQQSIAVPEAQVEGVLGMLNEFEINRFIVVDPSKDILALVQTHFDLGTFEVGGYCRSECPKYWNRLINSAFIVR